MTKKGISQNSIYPYYQRYTIIFFKQMFFKSQYTAVFGTVI